MAQVQEQDGRRSAQELKNGNLARAIIVGCDTEKRFARNSGVDDESQRAIDRNYSDQLEHENVVRE